MAVTCLSGLVYIPDFLEAMFNTDEKVVGMNW